MTKSYDVLVEADAWISVIADSDEDAEEKAKEVLVHNPFGWDTIKANVIGEGKEED